MGELILGESVEHIIDHRGKTPKKLGGEFQQHGIPVASAMLVREGRLFLQEARKVSQLLYEKWMPIRLRRHDVLLTSEAPLGRVSLVPDDDPMVLGQRLFGLRGRRGVLHNRYLFYALQSEFVQNELRGRATGTTVLGIRQSELLKVRIPAPAYSKQQAIAGVLGALDDKIAVNDRIAAMVDTVAAELLEELLESSSEQLSRVSLGQIAEINRVKTTPTKGRYLRYIDISSVSVGVFEWPERIPWEKAPGRARRGVSPGDILWSTVRPNRRSHALLLDEDPELVASTGLVVLTPNGVGPGFLYEITRRMEFTRYLESVAEGSAYPAVRADRFAQALVLLPPQPRLARFEDKVMVLRTRAHSAWRENRTLATLRDTLLPKLMSGQLRVKDAERIVEDAV